MPKKQALERWIVSRWEKGAWWPVGKKNDKSRPFLGQSHLHDDEDDDEVKHLKVCVTSLKFSIKKDKYHQR